MSRRFAIHESTHSALFKPVENDNEPEPDPIPIAPPVIILSQSGDHSRTSPREQQVQPRWDPAPLPTTSSMPLRTPENQRYDLRKKDHRLQPTPPANSLRPRKRPASASPPHSTPPTPPISLTPSGSNASASPPKQSHKHPSKKSRKMGSKVSKITGSNKLQPSTAKSDKEEMKEPSNYYTHRSKSMRKKAGKTPGGAAAGGAAGGSGGSGGGL